MPIVNCPDCNGIVSDAAPACPHCGKPEPAKSLRKKSLRKKSLRKKATTQAKVIKHTTAAQKGNPVDQNKLGNELFEQGDFKKAFTWRNKAAKQGYPKSMHSVGLSYLNGKGITKNPRKAVDWFKKAVKLKYKPSHLVLGQCYSDGNGSLRDYPKAAETWRRGGELGDADCAFLAGRIYGGQEENTDFDVDYTIAIKCYKRAIALRFKSIKGRSAEDNLAIVELKRTEEKTNQGTTGHQRNENSYISHQPRAKPKLIFRSKPEPPTPEQINPKLSTQLATAGGFPWFTLKVSDEYGSVNINGIFTWVLLIMCSLGIIVILPFDASVDGKPNQSKYTEKGRSSPKYCTEPGCTKIEGWTVKGTGMCSEHAKYHHDRYERAKKLDAKRN